MVEVWNDKSGADFNKLCKNFIVKLSEEIEGHFPEGAYTDFEIFIPDNLPSTVAEAQFYGLSKIHNLAVRFSLSPSDATQQWVAF